MLRSKFFCDVIDAAAVLIILSHWRSRNSLERINFSIGISLGHGFGKVCLFDAFKGFLQVAPIVLEFWVFSLHKHCESGMLNRDC